MNIPMFVVPYSILGFPYPSRVKHSPYSIRSGHLYTALVHGIVPGSNQIQVTYCTYSLRINYSVELNRTNLAKSYSLYHLLQNWK